ncbi:hypothetical protein GCM10028777_34490 [Angustibacter speluncae]
MTTTCECGAAVPESAAWCSLCHRPVTDARFAPPTDAESVLATERRETTSVAEQARTRRESSRPTSRFASTDVTFGLRGRIVMSLLVLLPFWFFLQHFATGGWVGVVVLALVGVPWAMHDIWRRSDRL